MNQLMITIMIALLFTDSASADGAVVFKDYKKLAPTDRQLLLQKAPVELQKQYRRWDMIINLGGQSWAGLEQPGALVDAKGFDGFSALIGAERRIWGYYLIQQDPNQKLGLPENTPIVVSPALAAEDIKRHNEASQDNWYLVNVAPTPGALELNKRALVLGMKWVERFVNKPPGIITRKDLDALDTDVRQVRDKMRKLPLWTPEEVQEAFAALPDQEKHSR